MRLFFYLLIFFLVHSIDFATAAETSKPVVWLTDSLLKVHSDAKAGVDAPLTLYAARNEWVSFQVHVAAGSAPLNLGVTVGNFVKSNNAVAIPAKTNVVLYREAYLDITQVSDMNGALGPTPDPLIPAIDPYTHEARNAFPVVVPASSVQSAWIDVLVPVTAPSGTFVASIKVTDGAKTLALKSVTLKVWSFALPSTASLKSAYGLAYDALCLQQYQGYNGCSAYPGSNANSDVAIDMIDEELGSMMLDHRVSVSDVVIGAAPGAGLDWSRFDLFAGPLLSGTAPTLLAKAKLTNARFVSPGYTTDPTFVSAWFSHFQSDNWLAKLFDYTCDEPTTGCTWTGAIDRATAIHATEPTFRAMVTTSIQLATANGLLPSLQILAPYMGLLEPKAGENLRSTYNSWLKDPTHHLWWYQSCSSHGSCSNGVSGPATQTTPSYMIDAKPVRNRIFQWLAFTDRIETELYYEIDYCWVYTTSCGDPDPWVSVYAFGGNGDGTLIYPGTTSRIGGTTPVPVPSVRLKHIRDGMQDYEYLHMLSAAGYDAYARSIAASFITNSWVYSQNPQALLAAKIKLGSALNQLALTGTCCQAP